MYKRESKVVKTERAANEKKLIFVNEYYSDIQKSGMLYAAMIRSPASSGTLESVSLQTIPEGYFLFSANDVPGKNTIKMLSSEIKIFCDGKISYKGECLALVTGPDEKKVRKLAENATIVIKAAEETLEEENPDSRIIASKSIENGLPFDEAAKEADFVVENQWFSDVHHESDCETSGAFCFIDKNQKESAGSANEANAILNVCTPDQWTSRLRKSLSATTGFDAENIRITKTNSSAIDTNTLWLNSILACRAAIASCLTKRPVKLSLTRDEQKDFIENTIPVTIRHRTAVDKNGKFIALDIKILLKCGAFNPFAEEILNRIIIAAAGVYYSANMKIDARAVTTNSPPSSLNLLTIDAQSFFAVENQIQAIAEKTNISPLELRQINIIKNQKHNNPARFQFEFGNALECVQTVCKKSDFARKYTAYKMTEPERHETDNNSPFAPPLRGISLVCAFEGTGFIGTKFLTKNITIETIFEKNEKTDGGKLTIKTLPPSKSIRKIWQRLVAEILQINENDVLIDTDFSVEKEPDSPEVMNSRIGILTNLLIKACETVKRKKNAGVYPIVVRKIFSRNQKKHWNQEDFSGNPFFSASFASCVMELEQDPCDYTESIRGIWIVIDAGEVLDRKSAEASIEQAVRQALSEIVEKESIHCENVNVFFIQSKSEPKQIGNIVYSLIPPAFSAALSQTIASTVNFLPMKNETLFELISNAKVLHKKQKREEELDSSKSAADFELDESAIETETEIDFMQAQSKFESENKSELSSEQKAGGIEKSQSEADFVQSEDRQESNAKSASQAEDALPQTEAEEPIESPSELKSDFSPQECEIEREAENKILPNNAADLQDKASESVASSPENTEDKINKKEEEST